ncbi:protein LBH-like [Lethenteron reissneri]|uniref:protein LBH-like n=1 Tax=Lethenteron reissneri TaxID=7753 RepID=UPI002AB71071|nr:protein LBH-like [Lethenteron reissneri]
MTELMMSQSAMEDLSFKTRDARLPFQIFPDPYDTYDGYCLSTKGRLPSIVVEPIDGGEVESGELRWPPEGMLLSEEEYEEEEEEEEEEEDAFPSARDDLARDREEDAAAVAARAHWDRVEGVIASVDKERESPPNSGGPSTPVEK